MDFNEHIKSIDRLLSLREKEYPIRGDKHKALHKGISDYCDHIISWPRATILIQPQYDKVKKFINNPIFIGGYMRSGTTLLLRLLDGHKDIFAMPGDSFYFDRHKKHIWNARQYDQVAKYWIKRFVTPTGRKPYWFIGKDYKSQVNFLTTLKLLLNSYHDLDGFQCVVVATFLTINKSKQYPKYWVEKTPTNENKAHVINERYPKSRFIHIIRNPYYVLASLKQRWSYDKKAGNNSFDIAGWSKLMNTHICHMVRNKKIYGKNYFVVRYEELDLKMESIAKWLGIEHDVILLNPTENKKPAISNSSFKRNSTYKIVNGNNPKKLDIFSKSDIKLIRTRLKKSMYKEFYEI